jgi:O-antigen/teichoic acid export membrane protein
MLVGVLREQGLGRYLRMDTLRLPLRDILAFVFPGLGQILATSAAPCVSIFLLGHLRSMSEVAYYRAALPIALLNDVVMASFTLLYTPSAARLLAKDDHAGINGLYWRTAAWMTVVSFPVFLMTFSFAQPLVLVLYGSRYQQSGPILALLALCCYFDVFLGFNVQTLKVLKKLGYITASSVAMMAANIALNLILIPRYGGLGAAWATAGAIIGFNLLMQIGLLRTATVHAFDRRYRPVYLAVVSSAAGLFILNTLNPLSIRLAVPIVGSLSLLLLALTKSKLSVADTFPELLKVPVLGWIFA